MTSVEKWVQVGEARLWSTISGVGTPTLFFNGGPGCDDYLAPVAELIAHRCQSVRFEPRGCGRSSWDGQYDLETQVRDADRVRAAYGFENVLLLGHSYGPNVALAYALEYPQRVTGIIGLAGGNVVNDRTWSATYREKKESVGEDTGGLVFHADEAVNKQGNESWRAYCRRPELLRDLAGLRARTVFINAANDIRPNWPTQQLALLLPNARYVEVPDAAHLIWLTHAAELKRELELALDFILGGSNAATEEPDAHI